MDTGTPDTCRLLDDGFRLVDDRKNANSCAGLRPPLARCVGCNA